MEHVNEIFSEFADHFAGTLLGSGEIVHVEQLDRSRLDFSLDSLKVVDNYIAYLHEHQPSKLGPQWAESMLWGGAYVGETIRRHASRELHWIDYDDFVHQYPSVKEQLGGSKSLGTCAILTTGSAGFTLPINKLLRMLHDGPADSIHAYGLAETA